MQLYALRFSGRVASSKRKVTMSEPSTGTRLLPFEANRIIVLGEAEQNADSR